LLLALEYIANKNSTSSPIAPAILKDAYQLLGIDGDKPTAPKPSVKSAPQSTAQRAPQPAPQSASQAVAPDAPKIEPAPAVKAQPKVQPTVAPKPAVESPRTPAFQPADTV